jgi:subtilase family serine protease
MKLRRARHFFHTLFFLATLLSAALPLAAQLSRITGNIDRSRMVAIPGHIHRYAQPLYERGRVDAAQVLDDMTMLLKPTTEQQAELDQLLVAQQDPSSPQYRQWLSPEAFADRFALSQEDLDRVAAWLEEQGFTVTHVGRSRNWVAFQGTVEQVETAFSTEIHHYEVNGKRHFANRTEPRIPAALSGLVGGFRGLNDFLPAARRNNIQPRYSTSSGKHYLAPEDLATIYGLKGLYSMGVDGTGQKLAVVGQTAISLADIQKFRSIFGLAANDPTVVLVPGKTNPGTVSDDLVEADLDLEWAGAAAPNATLVYVYSKNVFDAVQYVVSQKLAPIISMSYGACEIGNQAAALQIQAIAQQANAQGITWVNASGDSGAADCDYGSATATQGLAVDLPASVPEVTGVGGTTFSEGSGTYWNTSNSSSNGSAISYIPEVAWNDTTVSGSLASTGGGASIVFAKPTWQTGTGVPSGTARYVPDVAMTASAQHDGAIVCTGGGCANGLSGASVVGGTSLAAPIFAGILTLLNHYQVSNGTVTAAGLGNVNATLYSMAASTTDVFHDIASGDNIVPCTVGTTGCTTGKLGYSAGTGYDQVTGLGSVNGYNLVTEWPAGTTATGVKSVTAAASSVAPAASTTVTVLLNGVAPVGGAVVTLTSSNTTALPVASSVTVAAGKTSASVTVTAGAVTAPVAATVTATYNSTSATVSVTVAPVVTPTVSSVAVSPVSVVSKGTAAVTVTLSSAALTGGAVVTLASSAATAFPIASSVTVAAGKTSATVSVTAGTVTASTAATVTAAYNSTSATASVTVTPAVTPTISSVAVSPASVVSKGTATVTVTLSSAALTGGAVVTLASSAATAFPIASSVTVAAGKTSATVSVTAGTVTASTAVTVTATYSGKSVTATAAVTPVSLKSLVLSAATVSVGSSATVTVTLSSVAPAGGAIVKLTSSSATAFPVAASLTVAAGKTSASATVTAGTVTASTAVTVTATYNGSTVSGAVTVAPVVRPTIKSIAVSSSSVASSGVVTLTVTLSGAAPSGGAAMTFSSSAPAAFAVPSTIVMPAGGTIGTMRLKASTVTAATKVTLTLLYNNSSQTTTFTVTPK